MPDMLSLGAGDWQYFSEDQSFIKIFRSSSLAKNFAGIYSAKAELYYYMDSLTADKKL